MTWAGVLNNTNYSQGSYAKVNTPVFQPSVITNEKLDVEGFVGVNNTQRTESQISEKTVLQEVEKVNKEMKSVNSELRFSVHETTHDIVVKIINKDSGEVLKEIPSEKLLDMVGRMMERSGVLVDHRI